MATRNIVPRATNEGGVGTTSKKWANIWATLVNALTLTAQTTGFTIAGGTTSKTLTVPLDASVSGTNTGDQDLQSIIASSISDGDTTHAPDGNSVFDALAAKAATGQKLDDFGTPDDNTDLNANTTNHGLLLKATAPETGLLNVVGIAYGETAYTNKALFDATSPSTQDYGDAAAVGTAVVSARRDHKHAMPAAYTHPTGDGNLHVPANSTTNSGKVLTAGATAGTYTWETPSTGTTIDDVIALTIALGG